MSNNNLLDSNYGYRQAEAVGEGVSFAVDVAKAAGEGLKNWWNLDRKEKVESAAVTIGGVALLGAVLGGSIVAGTLLERHPSSPKPAPIETPGDHHGSTVMPSQQHLEKFTAEHGISLNRK